MRNNNINIKARIKRHLRILRDSGAYNKNKQKKWNYSKLSVLFFIVFIFPIYPSIASVVYKNTETDFYRGDIDESSIIDSYYASDNLEDEYNSYLNENVDSFVSVDTIVSGKRDTEGSNEIVNYIVKSGDSYNSISSDFGISKNTILWANDFSSTHIIHPGDNIKIPPVTGLVYKVQKGDNIEYIAKKYDISLAKIKEQNSLNENSIIRVGQNLILPGAKKIIQKPKPIIKPKNTYYAKTSSKQQNTSKKLYTAEKGTYQLNWRSTKRNFAWGNCTYFVSHYKNVTWRGNANQWIRNARSKGVPTGNIAKPGAIVQFTGRGYNPRYGHVGIVTKVSGDYMIVTDMNYKSLNVITNRKVPLNHPTIDGYIYAE